MKDYIIFNPFSIYEFFILQWDNYDEQTICLAQNIYHEARGEIIDGQIAVSNVIEDK